MADPLMKIAENTLQFVALTSLFAKRADDELKVHRQAQTKAAAQRASLLQYMLDNNIITAQQKQSADMMLASHAETMNLAKMAMEKLVAERAKHKKEASELGAGADHPSETPVTPTGVNSLTDNSNIGGHRPYMKESDKIILSALQQ